MHIPQKLDQTADIKPTKPIERQKREPRLQSQPKNSSSSLITYKPFLAAPTSSLSNQISPFLSFSL